VGRVSAKLRRCGHHDPTARAVVCCLLFQFPSQYSAVQ
jgi:hypothetical protein